MFMKCNLKNCMAIFIASTMFLQSVNLTFAEEVVQDFIEDVKNVSGNTDNFDIDVYSEQDNNLKVMATDYPSYAVTGGNIYYNPDTGEIKSADTTITNAIIPSKINGTIITSIAASAFAKCTVLQNISLPETLEKIGASAFSGCSSLKELVIPEGVTTIGAAAIHTTSIESIKIPKSVISAGSNDLGMISGCDTLKEIIFEDGMTKIPAKICRSYKSNNIERVVIPESVEEIGVDAFYNCTNLGSIDLPPNLKIIGANAFSGCSSLKELTIPKGVTTIGAAAIHTTSIESIIIPKSVTSAGSNDLGMISGCDTLKEIIFEDGMTKIPAKICRSYKSNNIERVVIPESVEEIGVDAFYNCTNLGSIELPPNLKIIGANAFLGCSSLKDLIIPEGVTTIGSSVINYTTIKNITIPSTVIKTGGGGLGIAPGCESLENVFFAKGISNIPNEVCNSYSSNNIKKVVLPSSATSIGYNSFRNCSNMTDITIRAGITRIADSAFNNCDNTKLTMHVDQGSYAEQYAIDNGWKYDYNVEEAPDPIVNPSQGQTTSLSGIKSVNLSSNGKAYNILTSKFSVKKGANTSVTINVDVDWKNRTPGKIYLTQDAAHSLSSSNGTFANIVPENSFDSGDAIYVIAVDSSGKTVDKRRIYLSVVDETLSGDIGFDKTSFKLFDGFSFTIPDDKPVLGNQEFKFDFGTFGINMYNDLEKQTFKGTIGLNLETEAKTGDAVAKDFNSLKNIFKNIKENPVKGTDLIYKNAFLRSHGYKKLAKNFKIKSGWTPEGSILGYVEGVYINGKPYISEGGIILI